MRHLIYVGVLAFCLIGTAPLEIVLRTRVYRRPLRLVLSLLPVVVVFVVWDLYAIAAGHWTYDPEQTTGVVLPGRLPLDELLFFLVIPICAVLTLEAVRAVKGWTVGDEPPAASLQDDGTRDDGTRDDSTRDGGARDDGAPSDARADAQPSERTP